MPLWIGAALMGARKAAGALFGSVARYPWQSACIALLLASLWLWHGKSVALSDLKDCKAGRAADHKAANARLAVSNASIATLQKSLSDYVGAGKAAKVAQLAAVEAQAKDNAALQGQADAIRAEVAKMPAGKCETPKSVISAKGL